MGREIERKFLVNEDLLKDEDSISINGIELIEQTYLSFMPEVRVRMIDEISNDFHIKKYYLTAKTDGDEVRGEFEAEISDSTYEDLIKNKVSKTLKKSRRKYLLKNGLIAELDEYKDLDLMIVEVEFESEDEANDFISPVWFGKEVTYDRNYRNKNISREYMSG